MKKSKTELLLYMRKIIEIGFKDIKQNFSFY